MQRAFSGCINAIVEDEVGENVVRRFGVQAVMTVK